MAAQSPRDAAAKQFARAQEFHRQGRLAEAEALYREAIHQAPGHYDALHWLGLLHLGRNDAASGAACLAQALQARPDAVDTLVYLGHALNGLKRHEEALVRFDQALARKPNQALALNNRGLSLHGLARFEEALASFDRALALDPRNAEAFNNRGLTLQKLGRNDDALASFGRALALKPAFPEALCGGGKALLALDRREEALATYERALALKPDSLPGLNGAGLALQALGRHDAAIAVYRRALALAPEDYETYNNLGVALLRTRHLPEALEACDRGLALKPDHDEALANRGAILLALGRLEEALATLDEALVRRPDFVGALINRGNTLQAMCRHAEAIDAYDRALSIRPHDPDALYNASLAHLCLGDFANGWRAYESRWTRKEAPPQRALSGAPWRGETDIVGRRLLLWAEQGMGDSLQFCRYVPILARMGVEVFLEVPLPLKALMATLAGVRGVTTEDEAPPDHDWQCPLLSLPLALQRVLPGIPAEVPYFTPAAARVEAWRRILGAERTPQIGIVCSGNPNHLNDRNRSIPLRQLAPLLDTGAAFCLLQKDCRAEDEAFLSGEPRIRDLRAHLHDFTETAAAIACLDLVISVDTSVAHLAGALARPVWILLPDAPDWRWMRGREDSPWYPTACLFRQAVCGDWLPVVDRVQAALVRRFGTSGRSAGAQ